MNTTQYIAFIKETINAEGWKVADKANKLALEMKQITTEQYSKAANLIAKAFLAKRRAGAANPRQKGKSDVERC